MNNLSKQHALLAVIIPAIAKPVPDFGCFAVINHAKNIQPSIQPIQRLKNNSDKRQHGYLPNLQLQKTLVSLSCYINIKNDFMGTKEKENRDKAKGSSKEKASFDQNGKGASAKYGQAGSTPNESGESGPGTTNKNKKA